MFGEPTVICSLVKEVWINKVNKKKKKHRRKESSAGCVGRPKTWGDRNFGWERILQV